MGNINFNIKFITPLLIHGVNSRKRDYIGLTGKALRGSWRFWFRALMGGMVINEKRGTLLYLENKVFGSSNEETGAMFRLLLEEVTKPEKIVAYMGFNYKGSRAGPATSEGYKEGLTYKITIIPREKNMKSEQIKVLLATIWLWANLGGIGQRARRGFGSPVIEIEEKNNPYKEHFADSSLLIKQAFKDTKELEEYLKSGIKTSWEAFRDLCIINNFSNLNNPIQNAVTPTNNPSFFIVSSFKQIAVGKVSVGKNYESAITSVHGDNFCSEMGSVNPRKGSNVYIRLQDVAGEFYSVVTWSISKNAVCARNYICNNCKCEKYLDGSDVCPKSIS